MRLELDDNVGMNVALFFALVAALCLALIGKSCQETEQRQKTERCKIAVESKLDPVTINQACRGI